MDRVPAPAGGYPGLPALPPSGFHGDAGDGRAHLQWNPSIEDPRVVGWQVWMLDPAVIRLNDSLLRQPRFVVDGLDNGRSYRFQVVGELHNGELTPPAPELVLTPRAAGRARPGRAEGLGDAVAGSGVTDNGHNGDGSAHGRFRVRFPDGQSLTYDRFRPVGWNTRDGVNLIYPHHFGNGVDIGQFEPSGLSRVIAPDESRHHPHLTRPLTIPLRNPKAKPRWHQPRIDGERVTFHYWLPLKLWGYRGWDYVLVWETWWPIEVDRRGCPYHGLARRVDVQMPEAYKDGYQVMLNDGFGPNGTRQGVQYYGSGFRRPNSEIVDFSGDTNVAVQFQHPKLPRQGKGYHPNHDCLQASPLIFLDWGAGSLTITARSLYWHASHNAASYVQQGADGVWPNLAWDLATSGERVHVETVEYLYTSHTDIPLPQRYLDARFDALRAVSRRMGVQDRVAGVAREAEMGRVPRAGGPEAYAQRRLPQLNRDAIDCFAVYHDFWHAVPAAVDDAYRIDESHDCNPAMKRMCLRLREAGVQPGFWLRPEFVKTSLANLLSSTIPTADSYYGYRLAKYPDVVRRLQERGLEVPRENPHWIRRGRDGSWPRDTPYGWVPMSLATGWWERVIWPTLRMSARLGFGHILMDGGFGGLQGVDYAPRLNGQTDEAVPMQPYWWRLFRTMEHLGLVMCGECTAGWMGGVVNLIEPGDENFLWMMHCGVVHGHARNQDPRTVHRLYQLYNCTTYFTNTHEAEHLTHVRLHAREFYAQYEAPQWIELVNLRQLPPREIRLEIGDSPIAGGPTRISDASELRMTTAPWEWEDVIWHFEDGSQVVFPSYDRVDWSRYEADAADGTRPKPQPFGQA